MPSLRVTRLATISALFCVFACTQTLSGQTVDQTKRQDPSEVLRVFTELVQTDVMVFDKAGKFVTGLTREDFELKIDGKPKPIEFFEKITAGSVNEESQLAVARGSSSSVNTGKHPNTTPLDRGRPVFFYVDDFHLDLAGLKATRDLITQFIDKEMGQNDEAAITSASGSIGFLQQLTNDRSVLRAALKRLSLRPYSVRDFESPPMTEYQAVLIDSNDREIFEYFVDEWIRKNPGTSRETAESMVRSRSRSLVLQAANITTNTLVGLEGLVRSARELPGRKLVFFISGGFFTSERTSDSIGRLRKITSVAARSGVVIYSMDARGLVASLRDASTDAQFDPSGRLQRSEGMGEISASQDALATLALDTGGKTVFNTNALGPGLKRALSETSVYYLLAWKPEPESQGAGKFRRIEVKLIGKPELTVKVRRGFFDVDPEPSVAKVSKEKKPDSQTPAEKEPVGELRKVMYAAFPNHDLPVSLRLSYISTPDKGIMLTAFMEVPNEFLTFGTTNGKRAAVIDVVGTVLNDKGKAGAAFSNQLTLEGSVDAVNTGQDVGYGHNIYIGPGLYQVRVGARDEKGGRSGSAHGWIEIPDLSSGQLAMSSVLIGLRAPANANASANTLNPLAGAELRLGHRFSQNDFLRFLVFVYNAARAPADAKPDVALQIQVVRDDQPVITTPQRKVPVEGIADLSRLPYAAELPLQGIPAGRYVLQITAVDRVSKQSSSQQTRFEIQ